VKPTVERLGVDVAALSWLRSGDGDGAIEIAFVAAADGEAAGGTGASPTAGSGGAGSEPAWVLMRVAGDPAARVLVYDRHEWECFLDGVRNGEFDDAVG
jgi:Domain of unknown function (DUF397)